MKQLWLYLAAFFGRPFTDAFFGLDRCLTRGIWSLAHAAGALVVGWWLYVPVHELLHAWACMATGGSVTRLEIDAVYGGALLAQLFPWVISGSEYAGRLAGFNTGGNDWIYLATDFGPYLLTLWPGVWLLRRAAARSNGALFGFSLPMALAPLVALLGDGYEIGSIVVTRLPPWSSAEMVELLRGDDLMQQLALLSETTEANADLGAGLAMGLAILWAFATYALADLVARGLGQPPVLPVERPE